jgi:hypothetical protein
MDAIDMQEIIARVKENLQTLDACEGPHEFADLYEKGCPIAHRSQCLKCFGKVDSVNRIWYERGLKDARQVPRP